MLNTFDNYSYEISLFDALLYEENEYRASKKPNIIEYNILPEVDIDNKDSDVPTDSTPAQPSVRRSDPNLQELLKIT